MPPTTVKTPRDRQLNIALYDSELATLRARAEAAGMRVTDLARAILLEREVAITTAFVPTATDRLALEGLKRLGNNLNQIARQLNAMNASSIPEIEALLRDIRSLLDGMRGHDH